MKRELSILIPTYNYNALPLVKMIHAEASELDFPFEIIVFDDGSPEKFADHNTINDLSHATFSFLSENVGRSRIRKRLAEAASFKHLLFLDADVLPANETFLRSYMELISEEFDAICGGITYDIVPPEHDKMLRYRYGQHREAIDAEQRRRNPWFIFTGNLLIPRDLFEMVNTSDSRYYGEDLLISQNLKKLNANIHHIDNPVIHLGIETSEMYIKKALEGLDGLIQMERSGVIDLDFTTLQQKYRSFKRSGILWILNTFTRVFRKKMLKNLQSQHPNLRYFDLYRLWYYSNLKKNA
jgi:glycosyltransferase involved in cell wall biosynthesis